MVFSISYLSYFPYNHLDDDDDGDGNDDDAADDDDDACDSAITESMLDWSFRLHEINNKVFTLF